MAKTTTRNDRPILSGLKKLRIYSISRTVVRHSLQESGFDPGPKRRCGRWAEFIHRHFKMVWATDFVTETVRTVLGPVACYVLLFIRVNTRRSHITGMTPNPDGDWMT